MTHRGICPQHNNRILLQQALCSATKAIALEYVSHSTALLQSGPHWQVQRSSVCLRSESMCYCEPCTSTMILWGWRTAFGCQMETAAGGTLAQACMAFARTGPQERQKTPATARKGAHKASFAIREPQPAGLSLKASLQQLRGMTNSSQAPGGREKPAEDAIMGHADEERRPQSSPLPSPPQAALRTPMPGASPMEIASTVGCHCCSAHSLGALSHPEGKTVQTAWPL